MHWQSIWYKCTIESLVVDCYNLWKAAQMGVAIGRSISKDGLEIQNYNNIAAHLKHPDVISEFYAKKSTTINMQCTWCDVKIQTGQNIPGNIGVHAFQFRAPGNVPNLHGPPNEELDITSDVTLEETFPYDIAVFIKENEVPEVTPVQCDWNKILKAAA